MNNYAVSCTVSMDYEITANSMDEARRMAIDVFSDYLNSEEIPIDTEVNKIQEV